MTFNFSEEQQQTIKETASICLLLMQNKEYQKENGYRRLKLWKDIRETGIRGDMAVEVMRQIGLFDG